MKFPANNPLTIVSLLGCFAISMADAAPRTIQNTSNAVPQSVFVIPSNSKEGHDPFYPESLRPYQIAAAANPKVADVTSLRLRGFSGELPNRYVIINNHTFAAGDEGDVITSIGRIHLRCIEVKTNSVVIEVGGQRRELFYSDKE